MKDNRDILLRRGREFMQVRRDLVHDRDCLEIMIMAAIAEGFVTRSDIVRTVPKYVGYGYAHVAVILDSHAGPDPARHLWFKGDDKAFRLHSFEGV